MSRKPIIAIAGASGFIGRWFIEKYHNDYQIIALSRKKVLHPIREGIEWRVVDLYSLSSTEKALKGVDYALYLVHSMQPSTRLNQSSFEDTDLLLADNFSRAAEKNQLKQVVYVGGILPKNSKNISAHLRSRYEVEQTLGSSSVPLTALRAGIIIGPGGSSFKIVEKLVKRLPAMICPKWTTSESQPIDVRDVLEIIHQVVGNESSFDEAIEIGGNEIISYMDLLKKTSEIMGKKRIIISVPIFSLGLSKLWVGVFSDSSPTLVSPLVESLRYDMKLDSDQQKIKFRTKYNLDEMIKYAVEKEDEIPKLPRSEKSPKEKNTVRSVQRLPNPGQKSALWVAQMYQEWLPTLFRYLIRVKVDKNISSFWLFGRELLKLEYIDDRSDENRQLFYIIGGFLAKRLDYGWLEFRCVLNGRFVIGAIHEFVPRLPWYIYIVTQAQIHLWVMRRYGKYLSKLT